MNYTLGNYYVHWFEHANLDYNRRMDLGWASLWIDTCKLFRISSYRWFTLGVILPLEKP